MKRLTVPEPPIELYKTSFKEVCQLDRETEGRKLSDLVERFEEPMVIALDAPWGAGKSVFLKCWVGAHRTEFKQTGLPVYVDAFRFDYLDDPLLTIVDELGRAIETHGLVSGEEKPLSTKADKARKVVTRLAPLIGRGMLRAGVSYATGGVIRNVGDQDVSIIDELMDEAGTELSKAVDTLWAQQTDRRDAMDAFREQLTELAADQKLIIVIDELDRCRPDYALSMLEVIKHFFDVPNVHFVLGVNLTELANSVRARYGAGVNAEKYLQKFYTLTFPLHRPSKFVTEKVRAYFQKEAKSIGLTNAQYRDALEDYVIILSVSDGLSIRDINRFLTVAMLAVPESTIDEPIDWYATALLIVLKVVDNDLCVKLVNRAATYHELSQILPFGEATKLLRSEFPYRPDGLAEWLTDNDPKVETLIDVHLHLKNGSHPDPDGYLRSLVSRTVGVFDFPDDA